MVEKIKFSLQELHKIFPEMPQVLREKMLEEVEAIIDAKIRITESQLHAIREPGAKPICEAVIEIITEEELIPHRKNLKRLTWEYDVITGKKKLLRQINPEQLKEIISLKEIIELHGYKLKKSGKRWLGKCPFHKDHTPSFTIFSDKRFHCFGCGINGDIFKFIQLKQGLDFGQALRVLARYKNAKHY